MPSTFRLSNPRGLYDPSANAYSHVAEVSPGAMLLYIAGQGGRTSRGGFQPTLPTRPARLWPTCRRRCSRAARGLRMCSS